MLIRNYFHTVEVVLTARAKVQEALAVARNVSASLEQHTSGPSVNSKVLSRSQTCNVGVFEIKSLKDEKKMQISKPRFVVVYSANFYHCIFL